MNTDIVSLFFIMDESYSLFHGGQGGRRYGGAGLQMYLIADELSKNKNFDVNWVFLGSGIDVDMISHPRITIHKYRSLINKGIPYVSRLINQARKKTPFKSPHPRVVISCFGAFAPHLLDYAQDANAKSILRLSADSDTTEPRWTKLDAQDIFSMYQSIDGIVVQSEYQQQQLESRDIQSFCIPNIWPDEDRSVSEKDIILWVASSQPLKQPWIFIELAKRFPEEKFVMVMPMNEERMHAYIMRQAQYVSNLQLINEQTPLEKVNMLFDKAKVFINTSESEGFPNTFLQSGASSTPILSLGINPDNILERHEIGDSAQWDFDTLCRLLKHTLNDNDQRNARGINAKKYVDATHNPKAVAEKWKHAIEHALQS